MTDEEFRALLRSSAAYFRRFITFLKFTGCRPGEASALRWAHIDWERCIAVIPEHKTVKKSGKPRVLILVPPVMKDRQVFDWMLARPEYVLEIPHHFESFYRYVATGRKVYGCVKRPRKAK